MALNQFAKISPIVNSAGFLLEKDENGNYSVVSEIKLKENEIGICIDDKSSMVMINGNPVKLTGGIFEDMSKAYMYAENNDGSYDGQIIVCKTNPENLYVIIGNRLYNLTENATKTLVVKIPTSSIDSELFATIENSVMVDEYGAYSKKYLINSIDIKMPGTMYTFYGYSDEINDNKETFNPILRLAGSKSGEAEFRITEECYNSTTRCIVDDNFEGKLSVYIYTDSDNVFINSYEGKLQFGEEEIPEDTTISLVVTYTILN